MAPATVRAWGKCGHDDPRSSTASYDHGGSVCHVPGYPSLYHNLPYYTRRIVHDPLSSPRLPSLADAGSWPRQLFGLGGNADMTIHAPLRPPTTTGDRSVMSLVILAFTTTSPIIQGGNEGGEVGFWAVGSPHAYRDTPKPPGRGCTPLHPRQ